MKGKIFNAQEVQSILNGSKVMFREVIKPQLPEYKEAIMFNEKAFFAVHDRPVQFVKCPYKVGQKIFVKERFFVSNYIELRYEANLSIDEKYYWLPAIKMKQEHSRIILEITDVKVERLKQIDVRDVYKEGLPNNRLGQTFMWFEEQWNATHKKPEEKFEANPFVWVIDFKINN